MRKWILAGLLLAALIAGCTHKTTDSVRAGLPACGSTPLSIAPLALTDFVGLNPLGNFNPPGHTFPTNHNYFYLALTGTSGIPAPVPALFPGDGRVISVASSEHLSATPPYTDWSFDFAPCQEMTLRWWHIATLSSSFAAAVGTMDGANCMTYSTGGQTYRSCRKDGKIADVHAGDPVGTAGGNPGQYAMDLGAIDTRIPAWVYANPAHVTDPNDFHVVCAVDYFVPAVADALRARFGNSDGSQLRTIEPVCGEVDQDVVGTAQGKWFAPGAPLSPEDPHLTLAHDNVDPRVGVFSVGTTLAALTGIHRFTTASNGNLNLDFNLVTPGTGPDCYDTDGGLTSIVVQLVDEATLRIERKTAPCGSGPWTFGSSAVNFER